MEKSHAGYRVTPRTLGMGVLLVALSSLAAVAQPALAVDFNREVRPILTENCIECHGGVRQTAGLSFVYEEKARRGGESGKLAIQPGDPDGSYLIVRVEADDDDRMPPADHAPRLTRSEVGVLRRWIEEGAPWAKHWAFVPPRPVKPPHVSKPAWCRQPVDRFILARLKREGLRPAVDADRTDWLRRVSLDLTGLPPTLGEVEAFRTDRSDGAFDRVVDRLLNSPHFGERWAAMWMDLARYADSQGYEKDNLRAMWPYRDWVIRAFNTDMSFDEFTTRQLAGDLLPDATLDDVIATAFHRNTPTNAEGGTDDEEFRVATVIDRVNTTWEVWQGVTFKCVQCHSHPYAPIEHAEYYRSLAFFNTSKDWDLTSDVPKLSVPEDRELFSRARKVDRRLRQLRRAEVAESEKRVQASTWHPLVPVRAESSGQTQLVLKETASGEVDILTRGTVSHNSRFTLEFTLPKGVHRLTALRIDVLPIQPKTALHSPEFGFVISELRAEISLENPEVADASSTDELPDSRSSANSGKVTSQKPRRHGQGQERKLQETETQNATAIEFFCALGDEAEPFTRAEATLDKDKAGWGAKPRITHRRRLILVTKEPVPLSPDKRLRLIIRQEDAPGDMAPLVMDRSRYSISDDDTWTALAGEQSFRSRRREVAELERERAAMQGTPLPVMAEQESRLRRVTTVFNRGNWLDKAKAVAPGIPKLFGSLPANHPRDRLALARWLVSADNPLTARVTVNRFWAELFGVGLVETLGDFGPSGQPPSHSELLDFLARRFRLELDWSVKRLLRELVLSATYRQASKVRPGLAERDPANRLLAHGPRKRLSAEMVRDNALRVSGLLSAKLFGTSVMPPQPEGLGLAARSSLKWKVSPGEDRYRRAVYTLWRRSNVYPSMATFDAPSRLVCTARRLTTNTPLQALVTLNDPVYIECAVALAERMVSEGGSDATGRIDHGVRLATGRPPTAADVRDLLTLYEEALATYRIDAELSAKLADTPERAALSLVANAILNLDTVLTK